MARSTTKTQEPQDSTDVVAEVMAVPSTYSREELKGINSFDDAIRLATAAYGNVVAADQELGDGFHIASEDDKRRLCGVPLLCLEWSFRSGDFSDYVSLRAIAAVPGNPPTKWIINDGGTGIARDLREYSKDTGRFGGLLVRNGLRVSEYLIDAETGTPLNKDEVQQYAAEGKKTAPACTFYLDTSA